MISGGPMAELVLDKVQLFGKTVNSKKTGVSINSWESWEEGLSFPKQDKLLAISTLLSWELSDLTETVESSRAARKELNQARWRSGGSAASNQYFPPFANYSGRRVPSRMPSR